MDMLTYIKERYYPQLVASIEVVVTILTIILLAYLSIAASAHPAQAANLPLVSKVLSTPQSVQVSTSQTAKTGTSVKVAMSVKAECKVDSRFPSGILHRCGPNIQISKKYGVPANLIASVILQESRMPLTPQERQGSISSLKQLFSTITAFSRTVRDYRTIGRRCWWKLPRVD
jgi:hypothetical protein